MIFDKYLIFTNIMCNNCILSNIYIGTKEGVPKLSCSRAPRGIALKPAL